MGRDKCGTVTSIPWVDNVDIGIASAEAFGHERRAKEYVKSIRTLSIVTTFPSFSLSPRKNIDPSEDRGRWKNVPSRGHFRGFVALFIL